MTSPVSGWHYGNPKPTITNDNNSELKIDSKFGSKLDMRCAVGNISRNIKIIGSNEDSWGGHL